MFIAQKTISIPCDFNSKFVSHIVGNIAGIKSAPYIATIDRVISLKSILGLVGSGIKQGDTVCVQTTHNYSQEQADNDLDFILEMICGDKM